MHIRCDIMKINPRKINFEDSLGYEVKGNDWDTISYTRHNPSTSFPQEQFKRENNKHKTPPRKIRGCFMFSQYY